MKDNSFRLVKSYYILSALTPVETFLAPVVVIFYIDYLNISFIEYTNFIAFILILKIFMEVPLGYISDKIGRENALVIGNLFHLIGLGSLLALTAAWQLIPIAVCLSFGQSLASGNLNSIGYEVFHRENRHSEFAIFLARINATAVATAAFGALAGGYLADRSLLLPMAIDITLLLMKVLIGFCVFTLLWRPDTRNANGPDKADTQTHVKTYKNFAAILKQGDFVFPVIIGAICFASLRTSLNFYQPILNDNGWSGQDIGILFALSIVLTSVASNTFIGRSLINSNQHVLGLLFGLSLFCCALLFSADLTNTYCFITGVVIHQFVRIIIPAHMASAEQSAIPTGYDLRTTAVSISQLTKALLASLCIATTGMLVEITASYQLVLVAMHLAAGTLVILALLFRCGVLSIAGVRHHD